MKIYDTKKRMIIKTIKNVGDDFDDVNKNNFFSLSIVKHLVDNIIDFWIIKILILKFLIQMENY